jgi:hypothetical protein
MDDIDPLPRIVQPGEEIRIAIGNYKTYGYRSGRWVVVDAGDRRYWMG